MSNPIHERPGVYSSYDASSAFSYGVTAKIIGIAAQAARGTDNTAVSLTGYSQGIAAFGEDAAGHSGMSSLLKLLFANRAVAIVAVKVADTGTETDYAAAFDVLSRQDAVQVLVCDSAELSVQQALRTAVVTASQNRRERIAVVGGSGETVSQLIDHAAALNSERMVLVGPDPLDSSGAVLPSVYAAAAVAGAIASGSDPAVPLNGVELYGLSGLSEQYGDGDIDLLVRGGVLPLESAAGTISPVRGITTRTTTGGTPDTTWRELTTILIVDSVIPAIRSSLRSKFTRSKNTAQTRSSIRSQVIVELEKKVKAEIIDSYGDVTVAASADDPTVCEVEFNFAVAHGMNQIYLTAHITV